MSDGTRRVLPSWGWICVARAGARFLHSGRWCWGPSLRCRPPAAPPVTDRPGRAGRLRPHSPRHGGSGSPSGRRVSGGEGGGRPCAAARGRGVAGPPGVSPAAGRVLQHQHAARARWLPQLRQRKTAAAAAGSAHVTHGPAPPAGGGGVWGVGHLAATKPSPPRTPQYSDWPRCLLGVVVLSASGGVCAYLLSWI